jgi:flagella basal body P-ring formation protein FlgA
MLLSTLLLGGVTITLAPQARVRGTEIELGSIAKVEGEDAEEVERVRKLRLGYAPAPGYSRLLDAVRLEQDAERAISGLDAKFAGAASCRVLPDVEVVLGKAVDATARLELLRWTQGRDAELELTGQVGDLEIPAGNQPFELKAMISDTALRAGPINVPVRVMIDGQLYRTVWSSWRVTLYQDVHVTREAIRSGDTLRAEQFELRRVPRTSGSLESTPGLESVLGSKAARDLQPGQQLRDADVLRNTLVKRGDMLFLEIRRGNVKARVAATAEQEGRAGDRIALKLLDNDKTITGVIVTRELAVIDLASRG